MNICFIGGGNMARAIIGGLKNNGFDTTSIMVVEPDADKRIQLSQEYGVKTTDNYLEMSQIDIIVLAVKPQQLKHVCNQLKTLVNQHVLISIAAGVRTADIARWLNGHQAIIRVMPNTPAQIQAGISALYANTSVNQQQRDQATNILTAVGKTLWLDDEAKMDAVTAISGSGPAYVFYLIESLQASGAALGLSTEEATLLALHTFAGASTLALQSKDSIQVLRAQVTSKGGTTEQGILALEAANIKNTMLNAAEAAAKKSKALGDELSK